MWVLKVIRSTMAATRRGSGNTAPHSLKGKVARHARKSPDTPGRFIGWPSGQFVNLLFAVFGTDLGTERGEFDANKRDVVKQAGRRNAVDLNV
jgi:hypothetical protein